MITVMLCLLWFGVGFSIVHIAINFRRKLAAMRTESKKKMTRTINYTCNICSSKISQGDGIALRFTVGHLCERSDEWNSCGAHLCRDCIKSLKEILPDVAEKAKAVLK